MNRTGDKVQHALGTSLIYCWQCEPSSCSGRTGTGQPLETGPGPLTPRAPPIGRREAHSRTPSLNPQNTYGLGGQTPWPHPTPPMFCLHNHPCCRSATSQPGLIGLLLQLDGISYFQCSPQCSGIIRHTAGGQMK